MSLAKTTIKYVRSLHQKKFRQNYNKFIVEGDKLVRESLFQRQFPLEALFATEAWLLDNASILPKDATKIEQVSGADLERMSQLSTPNEALAVLEQKNHEADPVLLKSDQSLFLDKIMDPGNFGTMLRIADWFGIRQVFYSPDCVEPYNFKVVQASMGAIFRVRFVEMDLTVLHEKFPEVHLTGTDMEGESVYSFEPKAGGITVIGSEHHGIRAEYRSLVNNFVSIPRFPGSGSESLNAAVATGIICAFLRKVDGEKHR